MPAFSDAPANAMNRRYIVMNANTEESGDRTFLVMDRNTGAMMTIHADRLRVSGPMFRWLHRQLSTLANTLACPDGLDIDPSEHWLMRSELKTVKRLMAYVVA